MNSLDSIGVAPVIHDRAAALADAAKAHSDASLQDYPLDYNAVHYSFAEKSIVPTYLTSPSSRQQVDTSQHFASVQGGDLAIFPAFGASMSYMRRRFACDIAAAGGLHVLPRVGLDEQRRLEDILYCGERGADVAVSLGIRDSDAFLTQVLEQNHVHMLSVDIAHGANVAVIPLLLRLRDMGVSQGVILGNVGSVEGFVFAYWLMKLAGFARFVIKVGIGPGSVCTTRINTGVGIGQYSVLEHLRSLRQQRDFSQAAIISDGGINNSGDFAKAIALSDGVMMAKYFSSASFEDEVLDYNADGILRSIRLFGMASAHVPDKSRYIEGSEQHLPPLHHNAQEAVRKLKEGLQSAMTYVDALDLASFRRKVRFATNSAGTMVENGVH